MGLKIWLPLLGNLNNQGYENIDITNSGVTVNADGKLGQCYYFNGSTHLQMASPDGIKSVCFWIKTTVTASKIAFADYRSKIGFGFNANKNIIVTCNKWSVKMYNDIISKVDNKWVHIALVKMEEDDDVLLYIDGELQTVRGSTNYWSHTTDTMLIGRRSGGGNMTFYMNDFRAYDHCLSAAEVKEISQGLVLHYKLDSFGGGYGNPNLCKNSRTFGTGWSGSGTVTQNAFNGFAVKYKDNTSGSSSTDTVVYNNVLTVNPNDIYTVSFWAKANTAHNISCYFYNNTSGVVDVGMTTASTGVIGTAKDGNITISLTTEWKYYWIRWEFKNTGTAAAKHLLLGRNPAGASGVSIAMIKLERGDSATPWAPHPDDEIANTVIQDSSGYNHPTTILGAPTLVTGSPRYSHAIQFDGTDDAINCNYDWQLQGAPEATWCSWIYAPAWNGGVTKYFLSSQQSGGFLIIQLASNKIRARIDTFTNTEQTTRGYKDADATVTLTEGWHHFAGVYTTSALKLYVDGELKQTTTVTTYGAHFNNNNTSLFLGAECAGKTTAENFCACSLSDFRFYYTALSAEDIQQLYQLGAKIDNSHKIHAFELNENEQNKITKTGQIQGALFSEFGGMSFLKYDNNIYIEPDGSCWVRVFHHNNPASGRFTSTNDFEHSVYIDENRWFNMELAYYLDKWEIMVKGKFTNTSNEWKLRWTQQYNPMTATFANVAAANVVKMMGGEGNYEVSPSSWGGLYKKNSNTYLCANNGTSSSWWGAVGAWSVHQSGLPGWGPSQTVTTTGYNDIYLRIDNVTFSDPTAKTTKNNIWTSSQFIEI